MPPGWVAAIFAGVLLSAFVTEEIGIAVIFGAFVMGMIMPRNARLTEDVSRRLEDFVVILLLPLFFAYTGLKTNMGLLDRPALWDDLALSPWRSSASCSAPRLPLGSAASTGELGGDRNVMNTRGLTELIVLDLALEEGVISDALFAMLVIMALVTTFMTGPLLRLLDPRNEYGTPVEEELEEARREGAAEFPDIPVPERSILVTPQTDAALPQLLALAEPLARSAPPRELILARLVQPPNSATVRGGLQTENALLTETSREIAEARRRLAAPGIAARGVAFSSADPGADLVRLAESEEVDLVLIEGSRPILGRACRSARSSMSWRRRPPTSPSSSPARASRSRSGRARRSSSRSGAPSTTGRRWSSAPGSPRRRQAPLKLSAPPGRPRKAGR